jgi:UDP-N-acetylmuramoyl-tripeptide--D-alanyl-D-alanine ligase
MECMNTALWKSFSSAECSGVIIDSRQAAPGKLFFALKGERFDGHDFIEDVLEKGVLAVVIEKDPPAALRHKYGEKIIRVDNTVAALQQLGLTYRRTWKCPVIAITGSNGKTTTKELIQAVLSQKYRCRATVGNLNNHLGIPLTLLSFPPDLDIAIVEMGANHQGEIDSYCHYTEPDFGLITNTGKAHLEGFGGLEGVIKGKTELYRYLANRGKAVFTPDSGEALMQHSAGQQRIVYGKTDQATYTCSPGTDPDGFLTLSILPENRQCKTHLVGHYNFDNAAAAVAVGKYFDVPTEYIALALESYQPNNNRSQQLFWKGNELILDAYNANPSSMMAALDNLEKINHPKKSVVLGEMMELGTESRQEHEAIVNKVLNMSLSLRLFVGDGFAFVEKRKNCLYFPDAAALADFLNKENVTGHCILIKGSRKNKLETIWQNPTVTPS